MWNNPLCSDSSFAAAYQACPENSSARQQTTAWALLLQEPAAAGDCCIVMQGCQGWCVGVCRNWRGVPG